MLEENDVQVDSSTAEDVISESSPEALEEATSQEAEQEQHKEPPFAEHPRWQEQLEARRKAEAEAAYFRGQLEAREKALAPQAEESDPYANMDAQTRIFYQDLDKRIQKLAKSEREKAKEELMPILEGLARQNAKMQTKLFHNEQGDVLPGSKEEMEVARYVREYKIDPEEAAWIVMGKKRVEAAKSGKKVIQQKKTQQKAQANLETSGVPTNSGIPTGEKLSFRELFDKKMKEAGL